MPFTFPLCRCQERPHKEPRPSGASAQTPGYSRKIMGVSHRTVVRTVFCNTEANSCMFALPRITAPAVFLTTLASVGGTHEARIFDPAGTAPPPATYASVESLCRFFPPSSVSILLLPIGLSSHGFFRKKNPTVPVTFQTAEGILPSSWAVKIPGRSGVTP